MFSSKYTCLFFFFWGLQLSFAQSIISGKVLSENNQELEGASVYFNNTTIGTISKSDGTFKLKVNEGNYLLIVSFLGYKTRQIPIVISNISKELDIKLVEDDTLLDEVIVKK